MRPLVLVIKSLRQLSIKILKGEAMDKEKSIILLLKIQIEFRKLYQLVNELIIEGLKLIESSKK